MKIARLWRGHRIMATDGEYAVLEVVMKLGRSALFDLSEEEQVELLGENPKPSALEALAVLMKADFPAAEDRRHS